ncbi:chemotaxis protein CheB [Bradyrhizobium sp. 169]|uniref:chemotaxis protein CheB n=1 Tax=Bradyrhizobium sp. 169 TaxID=2782640 RepID=UPI001FF73344|nr:chemotaxis protein CheB [Bradyrhizobium sp. 169]MCK1587768.1 chemotaxis protein CheB [Bradyrhizobium sp. 169]
MANSSTWFVAIGASGAEGMSDLLALLRTLPSPIPGVTLVVLHRRWNRTSNLKAVLARGCPHPIVIADEGQSFEAGTVYIGQPAAHLVLAERSFGELVQDPGFAYRNRTIDLLFRSVAAHAKPHVIGVVLSGSLDDGSRGLASIHAAGGLTMVITPDSPTPPGMPENAIGYDGPIDLIGSPTQIAAGISRAMAKIPSLPGLEVHPVQQTSQLDAEDPSS